MRRRATNVVRVLDRCARCGHRPDLYDVTRVHAHLGGRPHELVVCRECTERFASIPTVMEQCALEIDLTIPVECMSFTERWHADPARVQRTAEHFLGEHFAAAKWKAAADAAVIRQQRLVEDTQWRHAYEHCRDCGVYLDGEVHERDPVHRDLCTECGDDMSDFTEDELVS